jgi:hypothetical protein
MIKKTIFNKKEANEISRFILDNEDKIKNLGPSMYNNGDSLTGRFYIYNFLNSDIGPLLKKKILPFLEENNINKPASIQCWANVFRKGENIQKHIHGNEDGLQFYVANIFLKGDEKIGTTYILEGAEKIIENKVGEIVLFNSHIPHYVRKNSSSRPRISMALDIHQNVLIKDLKRFYHWI